MRSECGARARSRKPCELPSKQTLSYKTPLDCSTKNQWLSCVLQNAAAVISTAAPVIGIPICMAYCASVSRSDLHRITGGPDATRVPRNFSRAGTPGAVEDPSPLVLHTN